MFRNRFGVLVSLFLICTVLTQQHTKAQTPSPPVPPEWLTHAEKTDYRETPNFDDSIAYARRLTTASPWLRLTEFGRSGQGRALPLVIASKGAEWTPQAAQKSGKAIVLIQACIHAGETDGKDAGLALLRDIAVTKAHAALLDRVVLLFIPIYNADGHERRSPYNRVNQNGPAEMGWRGNASNLNLNRDYMKADAPETRAWLRLWNEWQPDLFIDCHVTDGADFRYNVTYQFERHENVHPAIRAWSAEGFEKRILRAAEKDGNLFSEYLVFRDNRDPSKGIDSFIATPRFATGYVPVVRNRPALLIETHMLKEHRSRVRGTYDILRAALEEVNRDPEGLMRAGRLADEQIAKDGRAYDASKRLPLSVTLTETTTPMLLKGLEFRLEKSEASGAERVVWGTKPVDTTVPFYATARPAVSVAPPLAYIIPPQWKEPIEVLAAHGLRLQRLAAPATIEVESYRFREVKFGASSFEGRVLVSFKVELVRERRTYPAGSVVVSLAQTAARAALQLLEPEAPDSFVSWGFFNPIFEQKEYAEDYKLETLAAEMLKKDEALRREFERRVASDPKFAASPSERLRFFYERSPYWDTQLNLYPVGRVTTNTRLPLLD
ncbi:MAG TPA: M14 family metallopeptidase [Pyrinomonadaceae bacterium]|nr:M14 family metallopeptidase [Pyrinomonadaceae bacterium]